MKVIILTAGYGRRMRPLTNNTHKTLLKISGKTVLQRIIDALRELNLTDITIITGYRESEIKAHLTKIYPSLEINYIYNERYRETNNIYSMSLALQNMTIDRDILLIESDLIFEPAIIARLLNSQHENAALVDRYRSGMDGTVVTVDPERHAIVSVIPPHLQGIDFDFKDKYKTLNIYKFSQDFCNNTFKKLLTYYAQVIDDNCYYELILGIIIYMQKGQVFAEILEEGEKWAEIDDPNDLKIAKFIFDKSSQQKILDNSYGGYWNYDVLDYCFIRNMYFPSSAILSELKNNLTSLIHNYGSTQAILNQKLATYLLCQEDKVIVLNGVSQIYPILEQYLAGKQALLPCPSFAEYPKIFPKATTYLDRVGIEVPDILEKVKECEVLVIVNPNNPTGSVLPTQWVYDFAAARPETLVVLDESFIDFSEQGSILPMLEEAPLSNIILLASLSKTLGVPGLRLGYVYSSNSAFNAYVQSRIPIWNINSVAEYFLEIILKHRDAVQASFRKTISDREQFALQLQTLPIVETVYPSGGNFLLISLRCSSALRDRLTQGLLSKYAIYVKDVSNRFNDEKSYLRLAVRDGADNLKFLQCFSDIAAELNLSASEETKLP
ncbi:aminotransferase class I/II-fold pyridoxal phosphate-dependent enzyme [Microcoleus sp. F10-C6]|uniref:aminotransferase class I/II-fold pyridoxal phosphate-dependent enzyme n=1 Tax=unclassified Microcoleus TaxID=2642155 RepID=UPI002FD1EFF5